MLHTTQSKEKISKKKKSKILKSKQNAFIFSDIVKTQAETATSQSPYQSPLLAVLKPIDIKFKNTQDSEDEAPYSSSHSRYEEKSMVSEAAIINPMAAAAWKNLEAAAGGDDSVPVVGRDEEDDEYKYE